MIKGKVMKRFLKVCILVLLLFAVLVMPRTASAELTEADFVYLEEAGELAVIFYYEGECPGIVFVSPSGAEYSEKTSTQEELYCSHSSFGGWSTYRIDNAEAGQWKIRYDKKNNAEISYSVVSTDGVEGICIQSFEVLSIENNTAQVRFEVTLGEAQESYEYTISAIPFAEERVKKVVKNGWAVTGEVQELEIPLNLSASGSYRLVLEVVHKGDAETFDSMDSQEFSYENVNASDAMEDFYIDLELEQSLCKVDWNAFSVGGWNVKYKVVAIVDGNKAEPIYEGVVDSTSVSFYYPVATRQLQISLQSMENEVLSKAKTKQVDFENGEYLRIKTEEVTGAATLEMEYHRKGETELYVTVNEEKGVYAIRGKDTILFTLENGWNLVEAHFAGSDGVTYRVSKEIYYNWLSPRIKLHEDINGKVVQADSICISGEVEHAETFTVNGVAVTLDEKGVFSCDVPLTHGENEIALVATTNAGVSTERTITVTNLAGGTPGDKTDAEEEEATEETEGNDDSEEEKKSAKSELKELWEMQYTKLYPVIGVTLVAVILVLGFVLCNTKKKKGVAILLSVLTGLTTAGAGILFFRLFKFNRSLSYVKLAEKSSVTAAKYLKYETYMGYVALAAGALLVVIGIVAGIITLAKKGKKKKKEENASEEKA